MAVKNKKKKRQQPKARASWSGLLRFGLVSFPVQAFNAHAKEEGGVTFHQLHAECHSRIRYEKVCPIHGEVDNSEIISGYEYARGRYVEVDPDELDQLRTDQDRALTIDSFIESADLDEIYYDGRMYFLAPGADEAREPYAVLCQAMLNQERFAVGTVVFSGREQLVVVRPFEDEYLLMSMLNYAAEIRSPAAVLPAPAETSKSGKSVRLAEELIAKWSSDDFDIADYTDRYAERAKELIDAKVAGREIVTPEAEPAPEVINLMDALNRSVAATTRSSKGTSRTKPRTGRGKRRKNTARRAS